MKGFRRVAEGIYTRENADGTISYYERSYAGGKERTQVLAATRLSEAKEIRAENVVNRKKWRAGLEGARNPDNPRAWVVSEIVSKYIKAGCPTRAQFEKSPRTLETNIRCLEQVGKWEGWNTVPILRINVPLLEEYASWRRKSSSKLGAGRSVDMELDALQRAFRWARWQEMIPFNPLSDLERPRFYRTSMRVQSRDCMPADAGELHGLAARLFEHPQSEALGWQMLLEAFTGMRTGEALGLRWDATPGKPGFIDGDCLHIRRSKGGILPWIEIGPHLRQLLDVMILWRAKRFAWSPWYFPQPWRAPGGDIKQKHMSRGALAHALRRLSPEARRTSHGLRAYYVTVRRSQGVPDGQIAAEIGDKTGPTIIESTYGALPPNWRSTKTGKIGFMPEGEPAWAVVARKYGLKFRQIVSDVKTAKAEQGTEKQVEEATTWVVVGAPLTGNGTGPR